MPDVIEYAVVGSRTGEYGVAGIPLTYGVDGTVQTVRLYDAGDDCVGIAFAACPSNRMSSEIEHLIASD
jgi:hypothetical protein